MNRADLTEISSCKFYSTTLNQVNNDCCVHVCCVCVCVCVCRVCVLVCLCVLVHEYIRYKNKQLKAFPRIVSPLG